LSCLAWSNLAVPSPRKPIQCMLNPAHLHLVSAPDLVNPTTLRHVVVAIFVVTAGLGRACLSCTSPLRTAPTVRQSIPLRSTPLVSKPTLLDLLAPIPRPLPPLSTAGRLHFGSATTSGSHQHHYDFPNTSTPPPHPPPTNSSRLGIATKRASTHRQLHLQPHLWLSRPFLTSTHCRRAKPLSNPVSPSLLRCLIHIRFMSVYLSTVALYAHDECIPAWHHAIPPEQSEPVHR
jgi:hypothetical protein